MPDIIQGASALTGRKEFELQGISTMRFNQFKCRYFRYKRVICADIFCGSGVNHVGDNIVYGSPIRLLNAYEQARNNNVEFAFFFSDIRREACESLQKFIEAKFGFCADVLQSSASDSVRLLYKILSTSKDTFLYLILDPNGPKDFPKEEVELLISRFSERVDVVPYISATTINRCIGARNKAGMQFKNWLGQIENFDEGFVRALHQGRRQGWIRKPLDGDRQLWTIIPTFGCLVPKNDWGKHGFVKLDSQDGVEAIKYYCGGGEKCKRSMTEPIF